MGFLKNIFKKNIVAKSMVDNKPVIANSESVQSYNNSVVIHSDLDGLLWVADGPRKNYIKNDNKKVIYESEGLRVIFSMSNGEEPSLIYLKLPVNSKVNIKEVERPAYYPSYQELSPEQRGVYWALLENPYNTDINIGFVFILYYGLERHLFKGEYEKAFYQILKLRDCYNNKSFQVYSGNALILSCLVRKRIDLADDFIKSLDKEYEYNFSDNLYVLCKYSLDIPMSAKDIMRMSKSFEFTKGKYIKEYPELFEEILIETIKDKYSREDILIRDFISDKDMNNIKRESVTMFANISIIDKSVDVPMVINSFKFKKAIYDLLEISHEKLKIKLRELRKNGEIEQKKVENKKVKNILVFDVKEEEEILRELNKCKNNYLDRHFNLIRIQEFYYKYRDINSMYVDKCIEYCYEDIKLLSRLQEFYYKEEVNRIKSIASLYSKKELEEKIEQINYFNGDIPAFKRLAIIYEKKKNYDRAIESCNKAIDYYRSVQFLEKVHDFEKRKSKLEAKIKGNT